MNDTKSLAVDLAASIYGMVVGTDYDIAILPWGATEPHNQHSPYRCHSLA